MKTIRVGVWGFGAMGQGMVRMLLKKQGVTLTSVLSRQPDKIGKSLFSVFPELETYRSGRPDVFFEPEPEKAFPKGSVDIVLLATDSHVKSAFQKIAFLLANGINVISTAEEMAFPKAQEPELSRELDKLAKENGVTVLGTGINPGFVLDLLILTLTGACESVDSINARRVNDLSPFGPMVMKEQGVGVTREAFETGVKEGTITGHVGFPESIAMVAKGLGWNLQNVEQTREPIMTAVDRSTPHASVKTGDVAGCRQCGYGYVDGKVKIEMEHPQQILPELGGVGTGDYIDITGTPNIHMSINPEIPGGTGTIAMCVNMIPHVINAKPGLKTMLDLPVPRAIMGDMTEMID